MPGCILVSLVLHGAAICMPHSPVSARQLQPIAVEYRKPGKKISLSPRKAAPRIGSDEYRATRRSLGVTLASEHYLERLHQHIDPNWRAAIDAAHLPAESCSTMLYIDADASGTILQIITARNTCSARAVQLAVNTLQACGLLPPPKILLNSKKILALQWTFVLHSNHE